MKSYLAKNVGDILNELQVTFTIKGNTYKSKNAEQLQCNLH